MLRKSLSLFPLFAAGFLLIGLQTAGRATTYTNATCNGGTTVDNVRPISTYIYATYIAYTDSTGKVTGTYSAGYIKFSGTINGSQVYFNLSIKAIQIPQQGTGIITGDTTYNGQPATLQVYVTNPTTTNKRGSIGWRIISKNGDWIAYPTGRNGDGTPRQFPMVFGGTSVVTYHY
jgi:hypothetical protein